MANNFFQQFAVTTASAALSFTLIEAVPAKAATITDDFRIDVTTGSLVGEQYMGSFSYDDDLLTGTGVETINASDGLAVNFDFLGQTFTEEDDFGFDNFPTVQFDNGNLIGLNYLGVKPSTTVTIGDESTGSGGDFFTYDDDSVGSGEGRVTYSIPEPTTILGTFTALGFGALVTRKFSKRQKQIKQKV